MTMRQFILTAVTDSTALPEGRTLTDRIRTLCEAGVRRIVLREKGMPGDRYDRLAEEMVPICREHCAIPVIAHRLDTAERLGVDDVQLSIDELRSHPEVVKRFRRVGVSVHSVDEAKEAESLGAYSVTAGHIFPTECKKGVPERGLAFLKDVVDAVGIPVYAIGGIDLEDVGDIHSTGASGTCLMSTMMNAPEDHIGDIVRKCSDINKPVFNYDCLALYAVTDSRWLRPGERIASKVEEAILGGATVIQLREKDSDRDSFVEDARQCLKVCRSYGIPLIINDDVSVAMEVGTDGVHLGQDDGSPIAVRKRFKGIIGVSAHNIEEAEKAFEDGADYIGCGAVFSTSTKSNTRSLGVDGLKEIAEQSKLPVVAIGGIDENNIMQLEGTGIAGVAVVSAIFSKDDIQEAAASLLKKVKGTIHPKKR